MANKVHAGERAAAVWLALGALVLAVVLPVHGPTHADLSVQMQHIAEGHQTWSAVHWAAFGALIALAIGGFQFSVSAAAGGAGGTPPWAWLMLATGALVTTGTAVLEATAVSAVAVRADAEAFADWWAVASGLGNGFLLVGAAVAVIGWSVSGGRGPVQGWTGWLAAALGGLSVAGWILNQHLGVEAGGALWAGATLVMSLWLVFFGLAVLRRISLSGTAAAS